eukprot:SAG11_NODE_16410_length_548_cov_0.768374_2_plen_104_part_01
MQFKVAARREEEVRHIAAADTAAPVPPHTRPSHLRSRRESPWDVGTRYRGRPRDTPRKLACRFPLQKLTGVAELGSWRSPTSERHTSDRLSFAGPKGGKGRAGG